MPKNFSAAASSVGRLAFWSLIAFTVYLSLVPVQQLPQALHFWDKAQHALAFAALAATGQLAYPASIWRLGTGLALLGIGIELAQAASGWRQGDWLDWLADCVGLALGLAAMRLWQARFMRRC